MYARIVRPRTVSRTSVSASRATIPTPSRRAPLGNQRKRVAPRGNAMKCVRAASKSAVASETANAAGAMSRQRLKPPPPPLRLLHLVLVIGEPPRLRARTLRQQSPSTFSSFDLPIRQGMTSPSMAAVFRRDAITPAGNVSAASGIALMNVAIATAALTIWPSSSETRTGGPANRRTVTNTRLFSKPSKGYSSAVPILWKSHLVDSRVSSAKSVYFNSHNC